MTLEQLQARLDGYLAAEAAILKSQEYTMGSGATARKLVRADLPAVQAGIVDLQAQILAAQPAAARPRRISYLRPY